MPITNNSNPSVTVTEQVSKVVVNTPGPQGPRGRTILNGNGAPAGNLGLEGDFYYDKDTTRLYGPKLNDLSWDGAINFLLNGSFQFPFSIAQVQNAGTHHFLEIQHNLGFNPNVTVKASSGDLLETGIDYNSINKITLIMAQPFGGTAFLS